MTGFSYYHKDVAYPASDDNAKYPIDQIIGFDDEETLGPAEAVLTQARKRGDDQHDAASAAKRIRPASKQF
ncbi:hypothetical protein N0V86_009599 [Didymella sp. IMI 355093]|nr:hypothetical protein N0V86_009599 [Didymella sp. IMI 355093]